MDVCNSLSLTAGLVYLLCSVGLVVVADRVKSGVVYLCLGLSWAASHGLVASVSHAWS